MRAAAPLGRRQRVVMQEAQRHRVLVGIGAGQAGTTDHHVHLVLAHVCPQPVPKQLDRALVAIGLEHAGAAKLHEAMVRLARDERRDVVFALRVEAERALGDFLAQHAVGADHLVAAQTAPWLVGGGAALIDDEQVIADGVIGILIAATHLGAQRGNGRHLLVEHLIAQPLRELDVAPPPREAHFEAAYLAVHLVGLAQSGRWHRPRRSGRAGQATRRGPHATWGYSPAAWPSAARYISLLRLSPGGTRPSYDAHRIQ